MSKTKTEKVQNYTNITEKAMTYLLASGLMIIVMMVIAVFFIAIINGTPYYWPKPVTLFELKDGSQFLAEIHNRQRDEDSGLMQLRLKIGNREINGQDFTWIDQDDVVSQQKPETALLIQRLEWGNAYGVYKDQDYKQIKKNVKKSHKAKKEIKKYEKNYLLNLNNRISKLKHKIKIKKHKTFQMEKLEKELNELQAKYDVNENKLAQMYEEAKQEILVSYLGDGTENNIEYYNIIHITKINDLSFLDKLGIAVFRFFEFIFAMPRESNTEGGIFPALFGTVLMVFFMSIAVFPLGVIAAIYLNEYAKEGLLLNVIQITIFNLAGIPSIVYGVFGLGFFVYGVGGWVDMLLFKDYLPEPTFGTGGILWASFTLAVLTLPVVIVASLEGLKSVPHMYKEGAYALSATKWEVIKDVVIPNAMPGMLTGLILAISRAAGEVAPLMITGVVKLALNLPFDGVFPFFHLERKFMHLGFHIYDVGFQSPNVEAARPMVFNTTLLLLFVVFALNLVAIIIRNKLRKKLTRSGV